MKSHDEEVEDLAEEEEEGVAVVLVLQVVPEGPQQALQLVVLVLDDAVRRPLGQELHQTYDMVDGILLKHATMHAII